MTDLKCEKSLSNPKVKYWIIVGYSRIGFELTL